MREQTEIMRRQVTFYLDRARAAARARTVGVVTEVKPVVEGLVRTFEKLYAERGLTFAIDMPDGLRFRGEAQDLTDLIGNLLDNAGKWAREGVSVRAWRERRSEGRAPFLIAEIDDDGPGLDEGARAEALERGKRLDESRPGSGLGLSIVVDLAAIYGGSLRTRPTARSAACARSCGCRAPDPMRCPVRCAPVAEEHMEQVVAPVLGMRRAVS